MAGTRATRKSASPRKRSGSRARDLEAPRKSAVKGGFLGKLITRATGTVKPLPKTT
jgi:hypothetical protein